MATYTYETIPREADEPVRTYEIQQSMRDTASVSYTHLTLPTKRIV